jgi:hypothetical protein
MMAAQIGTKTTTGSQVTACACGCAPCEETSCTLDCVIRPRYFCGQLLTDADLNAGLIWSQDKFRLSRRRHGWGVVCGLEVSCAPTPGLVTVDPGYAVDCCGDDIVVCRADTLDINAQLQRPTAQCDPLTTKPKVELGKVAEEGQWVVVDVSISYVEQDSIPTTTLGRAACAQAGECENSRTKEGYQLNAREVARFTAEEVLKWNDQYFDRYSNPLLGPDPLKQAATQWVNNFSACKKSIQDLNLQDGQDLISVRKALRAWHDNHPGYQLCYLNDFYATGEPLIWLEQNIQQSEVSFAFKNRQDCGFLEEFLFLSMQDCLHRFLAMGCKSCVSEGVPLARVWLKSTVQRGKVQYMVTRISALPPYRRELQPDRLPAPLGQVNLGEVIWRDPIDATAILARYGIFLDVSRSQPLILHSINEVLDQFDPASYFLTPGCTYRPVIYIDKLSVEYVVGVGPGQSSIGPSA